MTSLNLNSKLLSESFSNYKNAVQKNESYQVNDDLYMVEPFSVGYLNDFVSIPEGFYEEVVKQLKLVKMTSKSNDLYKFQQSKDFKFLKKNKILNEIRTFFLKTILPWMKEVSDIDLYDDEIDITYSIYKDSDYLLCHDDHLEARRIAFIWYLVDNDWTESNGGHLDIITTDSSGEPLKVEKSFLPKQNSFVFFKVADNSYHQVREVKLETDAIEKSRISINGWFRGPSIKFKDVALIPSPEKLSPIHIEEALIYEWINGIYLSDQVISEISEDFVNDSEIQLLEFFNEAKFSQLSQSLDSIKYSLSGPMNVMQTYLPVSNEDELPDIVREVQRVLRSEAMMVLLSDMTNLSLHGKSQKNKETSDNEESNEETVSSRQESPARKKIKTDSECDEIRIGTVSNIELRHWKSGCYNLLRDGDQRNKENRLELYYSIGFPKNKSESLDCGGFYSYLAEGEDEELLTIVPCNNALSLVYADDQTMGFMKYITHRYEATSNLYDFHATFYEYE